MRNAIAFFMVVLIIVLTVTIGCRGDATSDAASGSESTNDKVDDYIDHALDLATGSDEDAAVSAIINARMFGRRLKEIEGAATGLPDTPSAVNVLDHDGNLSLEGRQYVDLLERFDLQISPDELQARVRIDDLSEIREATMLLDQRLVRNGTCTAMEVEQLGVFWLMFRHNTSYGMSDIVAEYGQPDERIPDGNGEIALYGRVFIIDRRDDKSVIVCRFVMQAESESTLGE